MFKKRPRKCRCCKEFYTPDYRTWRWQRHCAKADCQRASKAVSQKRWLKKPENRDYFCGPEHVERKRRWRAEHPEQAKRRGTKSPNVPQDVRVSQPTVITTEFGDLANCVPQDVMTSQRLVLIGLIAKLTDCTSQDEIASASRNLIRLGQDIIRGGGDGTKAGVGAEARAASAAPV